MFLHKSWIQNMTMTIIRILKSRLIWRLAQMGQFRWLNFLWSNVTTNICHRVWKITITLDNSTVLNLQKKKSYSLTIYIKITHTSGWQSRSAITKRAVLLVLQKSKLMNMLTWINLESRAGLALQTLALKILIRVISKQMMIQIWSCIHWWILCTHLHLN